MQCKDTCEAEVEKKPLEGEADGSAGDWMRECGAAAAILGSLL